MITKYKTTDFEEFMYTLNDFDTSVRMLEFETQCTWDMEVKVSKNQYIIYLKIDGHKDKDKSK
tara:strand:- start:433 stop:621 length:189 start_codon:yes stop_codon:yes gene_type:complete